MPALTQDADAAHLTLRRQDGSHETVHSRWVIGSDGGHSSVRHLVGANLQGRFNGERFILGDCDAEHQLDTTSMYTFFSPAGPVVTLPMRGERVRFLAQVHDAAGTPLNPHPTQDELQRILDGSISVGSSR